jgi:hypothetical protein
MLVEKKHWTFGILDLAGRACNFQTFRGCAMLCNVAQPQKSAEKKFVEILMAWEPMEMGQKECRAPGQDTVQ